MLQLSARITLAIFLSGTVFAQPAPKAAFEIADVHIADIHAVSFNQRRMRGDVLIGGRYELRMATMVDLIRIAYSVDANRVFGGPSWLEWGRFDVIAKAPQSTPPATIKLMLQALLADRFKLVVHNDTKPVPAYVLSRGSGELKMTKAEPSGDTGCKAGRRSRLTTHIQSFPATT
jgi:uncharacterized protein (TIGR03435 family)